MARAIIRYSFNAPDSKGSNLEMGKVLGHTGGGFEKRGTAMWESESSLAEAVPALKRALDLAVKRGNLDHIWIYVDDGPS
jgi:hypothetical protein